MIVVAFYLIFLFHFPPHSEILNQLSGGYHVSRGTRVFFKSHCATRKRCTQTRMPILNLEEPNLTGSVRTLDVCVLRLDSVANPLPQMLQWKGRFLALSTWASWFLKCCWRLDNWMKALPHSGRWHLYGLSPKIERTPCICYLYVSGKFDKILL